MEISTCLCGDGNPNFTGNSSGFLSTPNSSDCNAVDCHVGYHGAEFLEFVTNLSKYLIPSLVAFGTVSNTLVIIVFMGSHLPKVGVNIYLTALAVSDTVYLFSLGIVWLEAVDFPIFHASGWCQLVVFLSYISSFLSAWFVVAVTVERYIIVCWPLRRSSMCTARRARVVVCSLYFGAFLFFSPSIWTNGITYTKGPPSMPVCTPYQKYKYLHLFFTSIDVVGTWLLPFAVVLVLNATIVYTISRGLKHSRQARRHDSEDSVFPTSSLILSMDTGTRCSTGTRTYQMAVHRASRGSTSHHSHYCGYPSASSTRQEASVYCKAQAQMTRMLLWVSSVYLLLSLPSYIMRLKMLVQAYLGWAEVLTKEQEFINMAIQELFQLLYYTTFVINLILYTLCNAKFREAFQRLCRVRCSRCLH